MYIFGGYDGSNRVNDFYSFDLKTRQWNIVPAAVRARVKGERAVPFVSVECVRVRGLWRKQQT